ncbi:hypothetical protein OEZ85_009619 [Tetradesmus obliquus]|uniref:Uncharacterized protein n=1 Tax=Tetradesmus obliquus TaxID=3088 RepID=A0ABY8UBX5_TETOB|nr:hypothetical protein OEZ85_009619 [Tetradesmus obliquus]
MGVDFIKMLLSTAEQTGKLKKSEPARTLQVPGKWLLHFCHDFASVMRDLAKMSKTSVNRLKSSKLVAVHKKTMTLLSQLINLRCTTRPSDPCLLDTSCCKLLIGEARIPTAAVAMYGLQQSSSCHVNQLLNISRATLMDVARGKVRTPEKKVKEGVYWTQMRELAMPPALSMLSLGHVILFCQMLDMIITGTLHARLLHKVAPKRQNKSKDEEEEEEEDPSSSSSSSMPDAAAPGSGGGGGSSSSSRPMVPTCRALSSDDVNHNKSMLFLTRVGERYTAQSIVRGTTKKGGGKTIKDSKQQAPEVLASSIMGTEQDVRSSTQKDALQSGVSSQYMGRAFQHGPEMQQSYCKVQLEKRTNGSAILLPSGDFSDVKDIPVHLKDSDTLEDGVVQDACVLSHTVQEPCPPEEDALVSKVLKSELFGHCQQAIQMVVDATPSDQRVERLYKGQKGNSKELMPAFNIASVDADFQTSTLCVASSKSFGDLLVRLPTLCWSGVRINDQQLVHEGFGAVFREQQQEFGKLSIGLRTGVGLQGVVHSLLPCTVMQQLGADLAAEIEAALFEAVDE